MLATIASKPFVIVLLDSAGKYTRLGDAQRVRHWLETGQTLPVAGVAPKGSAKRARARTVAYVAPRAGQGGDTHRGDIRAGARPELIVRNRVNGRPG